MLLIKYDGITNVKEAVRTWRVNLDENSGNMLNGFYCIRNNTLEYLPSNTDIKKHVVYKSSEVAKWTSSNVLSLPNEILKEVRKRCKHDVSNCCGLMTCFAFSEQPEGYDFWIDITKNKFYKFYEKYNNINIITNYETELQDKNSSVIRGEEPKRSIICGKKSCASITSGSIKYGRISRGK